MANRKHKPVVWRELPKQVYVVCHAPDTDGDNYWLEADRETDGFENGDKIGIYVLKEIKTKKIRHELE